MKFITHFFRFIIGVLFIFSGFVKLIDPKGSAYKFAEYFGADVLNLEFLIPFALPFAIFLIIAEVILGVTLLVGYIPKITVWSLLALMLIFLFLTFYSAYTGKVTDCGCFGDFLKLDAWPTFYKNLIFTPLVVWLVFSVKDIKPFYSMKLSRFITIVFLLVFGFITYYVLNYLPLFDFRPYKVGKNIPEQMIYPKDAAKDVFEDTWIYKVDGEDKKFTSEEKPWEIKGAEYVARKTVLITKGYEPPIHDFTMEREGRDHTERLMQSEKLMLIIAYDLAKTNVEGFANIKKATDIALDNGYDVFLMSASTEEDFKSIKEEYQLDFDMLFCDETTLKTMIRSSPGIMTINKGTIEGKWSYKDFGKVKIKEGMGRKIMTIDFNLKDEIEKIFKNDQKYRLVMNAESPRKRDSIMRVYGIPQDSLGTDFFAKQTVLDKENILLIDKIIKERGYPGQSLVGELNKDYAWSVIMHSEKIDKYIDLIKEAAEKNELTYTKVAAMEDLYLMHKGKPQIYGTQTAYINEKVTIWPIKDVEGVNIVRKDAGFTQTIQEYAKELFGEDYIFEPIKIEAVKK
ncbi:MAG: DoxX family protein [Flavobacteriaceae bacterium]|nr:DoxX family protein [Flavobacteriaceae bacterium]